MRKLLKSFVVVAILSGIVAGCGGGQKVHYVPSTMKNAFEAKLQTSHYIIESPNVIGMSGRVALVREGDLVVFFIGDSLEAKLKKVQSKRALFVTRNTTPYVHFMVDFMIAAGDTIKVGEAAANLPALRDAGDFQTPDSYTMVAIDQLTPNRRTLKYIQNKHFLVIGAKVGKTDTTDATGAPVEKFTINLKNVKFAVNPVNEGVSAILRAMQKEESNFEGGLQYGKIPESREQRESHGIGGNVDIGFFKYMGQMVVLKFN
ncbi:MAG TPA: hypothetical protein VMT60_03590 [Candidatus Bathyarchaeia archaeon]|nr:hypothetical protein [Candidatus Bathyarchaeia archaeon]